MMVPVPTTAPRAGAGIDERMEENRNVPRDAKGIPRGKINPICPHVGVVGYALGRFVACELDPTPLLRPAATVSADG